MKKIIFIGLTISLFFGCEDKYQEGYNEGYKIGYEKGYEIGHSEGYWEGTQFLIEGNLLPTIGFGILIALLLVVVGSVIGIFYQSWIYFFKEKWVRYSTLKKLNQLKESATFKQYIKNKSQAEQFAILKENEIKHSVGMLQLNGKISDMIINSYPKTNENSDIYNLL